MSKSSKKQWWSKYVGKGSKSESHHSFWADEFEVDYTSDTFKGSLSEHQIDTLKKYRLSSARKAISNFVTIATGKSIPVAFHSNQSYTDGKSVVISGDIDEAEKFDVGVGLALHEGSHILLSDFQLLQELGRNIPSDLIEEGRKRGDEPVATIKNILNFVEDRRIDAYIYQNAPGYREYYLKLYDKYFGDKLVTEALTGDEWTSETIENYMNRLINLMNPSSSLSALKGLRSIWNVLDLRNIGRLKTTREAFDIALEIYRIILQNVPVGFLNKKDNNQQQGQDDGEGESDKSKGSAPNAGDEQSDKGGDSVGSDGDGDPTDGGEESDKDQTATNGKGSKTSKSGMSSAKQNRLKRILNDQKDFMNGQTKKKKLTKGMVTEIDAVDVSGAELVHTADSLKDRYGNKAKGVDVVVYKTLTKQMLMDGHLKIANPEFNYKVQPAVVTGLKQIMTDEDFRLAESMGTQLAKRLQVRNEARTTVFNRQRNGKIDKRLLHSLGFDAEGVFTQMHVDKYKKGNIHLSIDASSSMMGSKWKQTMINTIAMAKAVSQIGNLHMQVSIRYSEDKLPIVVMAWDSRKDSYKKVQTIFPYLHPHGTTPEGLCFEAISKLIVPSTNDTDSYFVNISDGEPCFNATGFDYVGSIAFEHTRKEVERIRKMGVGVLSYFVSDYKAAPNTAFKTMYGSSAFFVDINNVGQVSQTMNRLFLTKTTNNN